MNRKLASTCVTLFVVLIYFGLSYFDIPLLIFEEQRTDTLIEERDFELSDDIVTVGAWNLQIFGQKKSSNETLMMEYVDVIREHDIFIVQEIRDKSGEAFESLCDSLRNYSYVCVNSSRAGSSSSKEQYGFIYRDDVELTSFIDYNKIGLFNAERPPTVATFTIGDKEFSIVTLHTKPDNVRNELYELEVYFETAANTIIIGDLNADCSYYSGRTHFTDWQWIIADNEDTTVGKSDCAYDRILLSPDLSDEYAQVYGITTERITSGLSDHYPVWVALNLST